MKRLNEKNLKLAIQKEGRLATGTINFLRSTGLDFESYNRRLFSACRNFPLEILFVRDDDIAGYVESGTVDIGIIGLDLLFEMKPVVNRLLDLNFGFCSLSVAVPKESSINKAEDLKNLKVATSHPVSAKNFFKKKNIPVEIIKISGSVEITPALGVSQAIVDIVSTGSTLMTNDLRVIDTVYDSQAILISHHAINKNQLKKDLLEKLMMRLKGVLAVGDYKYILMNAPREIIPKLKSLVPGLKSPTIAFLQDKKWASIQAVIKEDLFWETIEKLKKIGASEILVLPIEKLIM